jgi:DNA modification methylase
MITILQGDAIEPMRRLPPESVHLIVTSPPYWGLRDYGVPPSIWPDPVAASLCEAHEWAGVIKRSGGAYKEGSKKRWQHSAEDFVRDDRFLDGHPEIPAGAFCQVCNAWCGVFGLEPMPDLYIAHLVAIMREAKRVLRKDGTLWLNLGDSYASGAGSVGDCPGGGAQGRAFRDKYWGKHGAIGLPQMTQPNRMPIRGLKPGDLVGIPWRAVFALQADGWWHRRDNIWFKPNPMPESVNGWRWEQHRVKVAPSDRVPSHHKTAKTSRVPQGSGLTRAGREGHANKEAVTVDCPGCEKCAPNGGLILRKGNWRCTTSHEYVFQFSKSDSYFCDAEAAREQRDVASSKNRSHRSDSFKRNGSKRAVAHIGQNMGTHRPDRPDVAYNGSGGRNRRSVWRVATKPYRGAHFATFPPDLVRPIISAASPVHCCGECAAPYAPVVERGAADLEHQIACGGDEMGDYNGKATKNFAAAGAEDASVVKAHILAGMVHKRVIGYRPTCRCSSTQPLNLSTPQPQPSIVLDPFAGSGTVGQVAQELGRDAILIELSRDYIPLIEKRCGISSQPLNNSTLQPAVA